MKFAAKSVLVVFLVSAVCDIACAGSEQELYVGWAARDIFTDEPVALQGQFNLRIAKEALDPITCTALAIETRDGDKSVETAIMVSCDLALITKELQQKVRKAVKSRSSRIDPDKIFLNATHTHTAPVHSDTGWYDVPKEGVMQVAEYAEFLTGQVADAVVEAWKTRKRMGMSWGLGQAVIGHNRRSVYSEPQSGWLGVSTALMNGIKNDKAFRGIEGYEDHSVKMLFFWDDNEKLTGILINVACPAQERGSGKSITADFWHDVRVNIRSRYGNDIFIFPQCGIAGDQSPHLLYRKAVEKEMLDRKGIQSWQELALRISRAVDEVMPYAKHDIKRKLVFKHDSDVVELPKRRITKQERDDSFERYQQPKGKQVSREFFFKNVVDRYEKQGKEPPYFPMEMHVIRLGDIAIASNAMETFLDYGVQIESRSAAILTFTVQLACDNGGYLPTSKAVAGGHYSAIIQSGIVGPEGGQVLVEKTVSKINSMWE
ncbi:MAG: hypothetical protein ACYTBP_14490 [Planctomycetota bacterium]|jgi:hypothetical protein